MAPDPLSTDHSRRAGAPPHLFPLARHLSHRMTPLLAATPLTPNQITGLSLLPGLGCGLCFAFGGWGWKVVGGLLLILFYTLDNCDGEIARLKGLSSPWGAKFDDFVGALTHWAFFLGLGYGAAVERGSMLWLWLGLAATAGALIDYGVDVAFHAKKADTQDAARQQEATSPRQPQNKTDWVIYFFHELARAEFCFLVFVLALFGVAWILLPMIAIGAQAFWIMDLFERGHGWHV